MSVIHETFRYCLVALSVCSCTQRRLTFAWSVWIRTSNPFVATTWRVVCALRAHDRYTVHSASQFTAVYERWGFWLRRSLRNTTSKRTSWRWWHMPYAIWPWRLLRLARLLTLLVYDALLSISLTIVLSKTHKLIVVRRWLLLTFLASIPRHGAIRMLETWLTRRSDHRCLAYVSHQSWSLNLLSFIVVKRLRMTEELRWWIY